MTGVTVRPKIERLQLRLNMGRLGCLCMHIYGMMNAESASADMIYIIWERQGYGYEI